MILGIDEVGRGPWAGPLVVGAVVLTEVIDGLTDSKKLSAKKRLELDRIIRDRAIFCGLGWVHPEELDEIGLSEALRLASIRAIEGADGLYEEVVIDGTINFLDGVISEPVRVLKKADLLIPSVSAASVIAKVARDEYMSKQDDIFPGYGFSKHVGYGTAAHRQALEHLGLSPLHRRSFRPVAKIARDRPSTKRIGDVGEDLAVSYIEAEGYSIIDRNWRNRWCEIDIVAKNGHEIAFFEVKYRKNRTYGGAESAITADKISRLRRAVEIYSTSNPNVTDSAVSLKAVLINGSKVELVDIE